MAKNEPMRVHVKALSVHTRHDNDSPSVKLNDEPPQEATDQGKRVNTRPVPTEDIEMCDECNENAAVTVCEGYSGTKFACGRKLCRHCVYRGSSMCRDCAIELRRSGDACSDPRVVRKMNDDQLTCPDSFQTELKKNEDGGDQPSSEDEEYNLAATYAETVRDKKPQDRTTSAQHPWLTKK